jgi:endoribonuclease Dicer
VTTSDLSLLQATVNQPKESIAEYDPLPAPYSTPLWTELDCRFGEMHVLARLFRFAREATAELGEWCGDQVWAMGLAEEEANKIARLAEKTFLAEKNIQSMGSLDLELKQIQEAKEIVQKHHFPQPSFEGNNISSKARILHAYLNGVFQNPTDARCIVFVNRRLTARLLEKVFRHIGSPHIRLGILIGSRAGEAGDSKVTFRQQVLTLMKFRKGELNCLVGFCP